MIFTAKDLARTAGFESAAKFANEMHRHSLPFGNATRVGSAKRYGTVAIAKAVIMSRLRAFHVPISKHRELIEMIDDDALAHALDQFETGRCECVVVGIPSWAELDDFSGVFVTRAAALDALTEADFILVDVGEAVQAHLRGVI
jgi:hypothetical protein